jgi:hypothetical protein
MSNPHLTLTNPFFSLEEDDVDIGVRLISDCCFSMAAGVSLDVIGWREVQVFHRYEHWQISSV